MITAMTQFTLEKPITREEALRIFQTTAPTYQGVHGLVRKYYTLSDDGQTVGGVYLWHSREQAEAMYTDSWRAFVRGKYNTDPSVVYLDTPVVVDNVTQEISVDTVEGADRGSVL